MPNAVWEYKLRPVEFVIFSYLCYRSSTSKPTLEEIAAVIHMTVGTVTKYLDSLSAKKLVNEDGTPTLNRNEKYQYAVGDEAHYREVQQLFRQARDEVEGQQPLYDPTNEAGGGYVPPAAAPPVGVGHGA